MPPGRAQVIINMSLRDAAELDLVAQSLGFGSRAAYVMHLHRAFKSAVELNGDERIILRHLGEWGPMNFRREAPTLKDFANHCMRDEGYVAKVLEDFLQRGILCVVPVVDGPFDFDVILPAGKRYQLTLAGKIAARAAAQLTTLDLSAENLPQNRIRRR